MHDRRKCGEERIAAFLARRLRPALYPERLPMDVSAWHIAGEPVGVGIALRADYTPFAVGEYWGGPWSTTWLRTCATVPERWAGRRVEALFDLGVAPDGPGQAQALVHDDHGTPLQGLHPACGAVLVTRRARGGEAVRLLTEAAGNPPIDTATGDGLRYGDPGTAGDTPLYRLLGADLALRDEDVWQLIHDMETLEGLMHTLPDGLPRRQELLLTLERAVDAVDPGAVARTAARARALLAPALKRRAHDSAHTLAAVGHAHLGTARLWPLRESVRTCARVFSTLASLAEEYPELVVAAPSAQHHAWMKQHQPHVFERIRKAVAAGNWAPVGGMWVPADTELPSGESLVRQFVYGRRFFRDELGADSDGVWLPGAAGASAALPQLARLAGARWVLGRRPDPGRVPVLPHHTFRWEGIDGTRVFTHLAPAPPGGTSLAAGESASAVSHFADQGPATRSLLPFGHHGTGPDRAMMERARRLADIDGSARVTMQHPAHFFRAAEAEYPDAPVWRGELDLALHRAQYAGQARTKRGNRLSEALLHEAELWSATAAVRHGISYPYDELDALWKQVLLQQSDDILPGTSIAWTYADAEAAHRLVHRRLQRLIQRAGGEPDGITVLNAAPHPRREVVVLAPDTRPVPDTAQLLPDGRAATFAEAPALGAGRTGLPFGDTAPVTVRAHADGGWALDNGLLRVHIDAQGLVRSVLDLATRRDAIAPGGAGNLLRLYRDEPARSQDVDPRRGTPHRDLDRADRLDMRAHGPLLAWVRVTRGTGRSTVVQDLTLTAGGRALTVETEVDWRERDTVLTCLWPLDVHAERSRGDVQFGHVARPTHENTAWDLARQETVAHRWIHVGEHGWGTALACDTSHGYDVSRHTRHDGGTTTVVRATLLRAPRGPDPYADRGPQHFRHALRPAADTGDARDEGYALRHPLRPGPGHPPTPPLVETVKLADDRSGDLVVRLYESRGGRATTHLTVGCAAICGYETDLLEERRTATHPLKGGRVRLTLRPFEIITLRLVRSRDSQEDGDV